MNERIQEERIREYLQQGEVQARILRDMQEARSKATVTISRAARLFGFSESQLREWEKRGLLETERPTRSQDGKDSTGHRQYAPAELDKLAIIRELTKNGPYNPGDMSTTVYEIWGELIRESKLAATTVADGFAQRGINIGEADYRTIDQRVEDTNQEEFWRYFVAQTLRISLALICEEIPDTLAGLILPLEDRKLAGTITSSADLPKVGRSLVGWLGRNRSFYTFLTDAPAFEFPSDFRLETLTTTRGEIPADDRVLGNVFIVLQRRARPLTLSPELIETVRSMLDLVYARIRTWKICFDYGMRDWLYQAHDLELVSSVEGDRIFNSLLERVLELGEMAGDKGRSWNFCSLLMPNDPNLPIQQQILGVRAQTQESPYKIGVTIVNPAQINSLSLKAFQSGQVMYFAETLPGQSMTTYALPRSISREAIIGTSLDDVPEKSTRSAIAIPISGESGLSVAVLYVAAEETQAFSVGHQRVLRVVSKMIEDLLLTSHARRQAMMRPGNIIKRPAIVDAAFREFASEADFMVETENLLHEILKRDADDSNLEDAFLSIISVDIDNQSRFALKYGNRVARNLSQEVGSRIRGQMRISNRYASGKLFHVSTDRYFLFVEISPEEAQGLARQLKSALQGDYRIQPLSATPGRPALLENMLEIKDITFHLGVNSYPFAKLRELLDRFNTDPIDIAVKKVHNLIIAGIEEELALGTSEGGNCILTWDREIWGYKRLE